MKWEYLVLDLEYLWPEQIKRCLNEAGVDGWELVNAEYRTAEERGFAFLKRPRQSRMTVEKGEAAPLAPQV